MPGNHEHVIRPAYQAMNESFGHPGRDHWAEDIEAREDPEVPDAAVYHGRAGMTAWGRRLRESFGEFTLTPTDVEERGRRCLVTLRFEGVGPGSGLALDGVIFHVLDLGDDGQIHRLQNFLERERALAEFEAGR